MSLANVPAAMASRAVARAAAVFANTSILFLASAAAGANAQTVTYRVDVSAITDPALELYVEESGAGQPVVFLHGLGESIFTWRKIVPAIAANHRAIAVDLKGFGKSDKPRDKKYTADDQATLIARLLEKLDITNATLVGHSFGGTVALRTALKKSVKDNERIGRLVILAAPALPRSVASRFRQFDIPATLPDAIAAALPADLMARFLLGEARGGEIPETDIEGYAAPYRDVAAKLAFLATARSIILEKDKTIARRYRTIREPALLIWCRRDPIVPLYAGKRLRRTLPRSRLAILEGCHHLPQDETPEKLLNRLRPFLEANPQKSRIVPSRAREKQG
jgi:pimeloyl-ACP methyl ester carboxylesterase